MFLFHSKLDRKPVETGNAINNALGPVTNNEHTAKWWEFESKPNIILPEFTKELGIATGTITNHHRELGKSFSTSHQTGLTRVEVQQTKNLDFELSSVLLLCNKRNKNVACYEKWILYINRWRFRLWLGRTKHHHTFRALTEPINLLVIVWWCATVIHHSFINLGETSTKQNHHVNKRNEKTWQQQPVVKRKAPNHKLHNRQCKI